MQRSGRQQGILKETVDDTRKHEPRPQILEPRSSDIMPRALWWPGNWCKIQQFIIGMIYLYIYAVFVTNFVVVYRFAIQIHSSSPFFVRLNLMCRNYADHLCTISHLAKHPMTYHYALVSTGRKLFLVSFLRFFNSWLLEY